MAVSFLKRILRHGACYYQYLCRVKFPVAQYYVIKHLATSSLRTKLPGFILLAVVSDAIFILRERRCKNLVVHCFSIGFISVELLPYITQSNTHGPGFLQEYNLQIIQSFKSKLMVC